MKKILIFAISLLPLVVIHAEANTVKSGTCDFTDYYMIDPEANDLIFTTVYGDNGLVTTQDSDTKFETSWHGACYLDSSGHAHLTVSQDSDRNNYCDLTVLDGPYVTSEQVTDSVNANTYSCHGNLKSVWLGDTAAPQGEHYYTFYFSTN